MYQTFFTYIELYIDYAYDNDQSFDHKYIKNKRS